MMDLNYIPSSEINYQSDTAYYILTDGYDADSSYIVLNKLEVGTDLTKIIDINPIYFDSIVQRLGMMRKLNLIRLLK